MSLTAAMRSVLPDTGRRVDGVDGLPDEASGCKPQSASTRQPVDPSTRQPVELAQPLRSGRRAMAYQSTYDTPDRDTNAFYRRTLHVLSDARTPFLVGGSHALLNYTGIVRETKDFDLFVRQSDVA